MKKISGILLALTLSLITRVSTVEAQMQAFACSSGHALTMAQGMGILRKVQDEYSHIESLRGSFKQESYVAALDEGEASSGEMVFSKPGRMRWTYKAPREQEVVIRERELWLYQVDKQQVMIDDIGQVLLSNLPVSFMMGLGNVTRDFELQAACKSPDGVVLSLVPQKSRASADKTEALEGFQLLVDEAQNIPKGAKITSLGGNITAIVFEKVRVGSSPDPAATFVLDLPKGVDVMDRRLN